MDNAVGRVRRFNRAVTSAVGALDASFLGRGRPLGSARVINAIGQGRSDVAALRARVATLTEAFPLYPGLQQH